MILIFLWLLVSLVCPLLFDIRRIIFAFATYRFLGTGFHSGREDGGVVCAFSGILDYGVKRSPLEN